MPKAAKAAGFQLTGTMLGFPGEDYTTPQTIQKSGGFGNPAERDPDQVAADVADGLYTIDIASADYRVALTADGSVDQEATARLRAA